MYVIRVPELFPEDFPEEKDNELRDVGPFELLQARQLLESSIAEFAAQQATKQDIQVLRNILESEKKLLLEDG